jgi:hypothetical protein
MDAGILAHEQGEWRVLKNGRKHDNRIALGVTQHQFRRRDAKLGSTA